MDRANMIVPFRASFDKAKWYDKFANICLWTSSGILVFSFLVQSISPEYKTISDNINGINCFFILAYALLSFITNNTFYNASTQKRYDFIDNSFETSFSEDLSINYFSNDNIENGIYKMAVNGFENSLFSYNIAKEMLSPLWTKNIFIGILFVSLAIAGFNSAFVMMLQLTLPLLLVNQAIKLTIFVSRMQNIHENYRRLFQNLKVEKNRDNKKPEILINVIEYEAALSWGCVLLDSKIYEKLNPSLSKKWEEIKKTYEIT
jgi:hypothetical protein